MRERAAVFSLSLIALASIMVTVSGCKRPEAKKDETPPAAVEVVTVDRKDISELLNVTGSVKALEDVTLSAKMAGKVTSVPYREGDRVGRGAVVVQQETVDLANQVRAAESALAAAQARLQQAKTSYDITVVSSNAGYQQAQKALVSAREQLKIVQTGARPQELRQAESNVDASRSSYTNAKLELERARQLFSQGAVAKSYLDMAQRSYDVSKAQLDSAEQALSLVKEGARSEERRIAENNVAQATERLKQAQADLQSRQIRQNDIRSAEAGVKQAQAALEMARQALADSSIKTPIAGLIASRHVEPGEMIAPGVQLVRVYNPSTVYFEATISEIHIDRIKQGQPVIVTSDAVAGRSFSGRVAKVFPAASSDNRSFTARIALENPQGGLKPGMFGKATIVLDTHLNQLSLPVECVMKADGTQSVYVVSRGKIQKTAPAEKDAGKRGDKPVMVTTEGNVVKKRTITTGIITNGFVEILSGLAEGEKVVRSGQSFLEDGQEVAIIGAGESEK